MTPVVPDINLLVYAFRADSRDHAANADWLNETLRVGRLGLADALLTGFVRIVTHPRVFLEPTPPAAALEFTRRLVASPRIEWMQQGAEVWRRFEAVVDQDAGVRGNVVPDAYLAALCVANGARLATRDRGFARFEGLRFFDPTRG